MAMFGAFAAAVLVAVPAHAACGDEWQRQWVKCDASLACGYGNLLLGIPATGIPKYDLTVGDGKTRQGLSWEVVVAAMPELHACHEWEHDIALSLAWYPWVTPDDSDANHSLRATWRTWIPDVAERDAVKLRFGLGAGAHVGLGGAGPRIEARLWLGFQYDHLRNMGVFVSTAYEPDLVQGNHRAQFSSGLEIPLPFIQ
jgi:hypothetical protein